MVSVADASSAVAARQAFTNAVCADWHSVLRFGAARNLVSAADSAELAAALDQVHAIAGESLGSEFFFSYFETINAIQRGNWREAERAIRMLGNTLLPQLSMLDHPSNLPVFMESGAVPVPAARAGIRLSTSSTSHALSAVEISRCRDWLTAQVNDTWLRSESRPALRRATNPVQYEVVKYGQRTRELSGSDPKLEAFRLDGTSAEQIVIEKVRQASTLISRIDPETSGEIECVTEYIALLAGRDFVGGSDIYLFGATFLRLDPGWTPLCYADHIVHEAAHQLMHIIHELDPLLLNRDAMGQPSPIRSDPRPLYGTFHATFVFLRLALFMEKAVTVVDEVSRDEAEIRLHRHLLGLLQGLKVLRDAGEFSAGGAEVIDLWQEQARRLVAVAGYPDPKLYTQLTWDYEAANSDLDAVALQS